MIDIGKIRAADRRELARSISLIESSNADHRLEADKLLESLMPWTGNSLRLGITGVPGVGKSTLIDSLGVLAIKHGHKVAVLTVDPSSSLSGGSILGDKTRMSFLARHKDAFIRTSPAGKTLGGVARHTTECILLCESAGFDLVIVETVGVGQSETMVATMTDIFLLMLSPASGDELQGIKRGIMELADIIVINKADGDLNHQARHTAADIQQAVNLFQPRNKEWQVPVFTVSALEQTGIDLIWQQAGRLEQLLGDNCDGVKRRREQLHQWFEDEIKQALYESLRLNPALERQLENCMVEVTEGKLPASVAARRLLSSYFENNKQHA